MKTNLFFGPPMSWYDPPEPHHSDGSLIREDCPCPECHWTHSLTDNYGRLECCTEEVDFRISDGDWCARKPKEHGETYMDAHVVDGRVVIKHDGRCLECEAEKGIR